ncbi:calcium dependent mitochondrial carrier protein [Gaeumannomyces tritici R3-111a-1]|uniref:Mitochondrial thiamine pyrophosphate carrier 1 n=1 Tax=Gaeumannomyces tritici (strain R3-111a-1) TaxID=644352 RepID=J3NSP9_GAET3|nr:calcium dependent mitochondrial carrier protein [Gaeumannomyces tritici R3-111a-1]EJT79212.1 calcium dependent mitochondrial carrier protein [Gaeumannomyces tritici R3-111a-1]
MKMQKMVSELEAEMAESQNARDKRMEELWRKLDPQAKGELDLKGLQRGLRRIDHPMKNADDMLKEIVRTVDTSGDGKIQYEEFRVFVEAAERELLVLFRSIDRDNNGRLDKDELRSAFQKCGLTVSSRRLTGFFDEIDMNNDGYISFEEWRDFLLFMPTHIYDGDGGSALATALSFYSHIVTLNAEGDSLVSEDTLEGLGTTSFLLHALFGSILRLAKPSPSASVDPLRASQPSSLSPEGLANSPPTTKSPRPAAAPGAKTKTGTRSTSPSASSQKPAFSTSSQATSPSASPSAVATMTSMAAASGSGNGGFQLDARHASVSQAHDQAVKALQTHFAVGHAGNSGSLQEGVSGPKESKLTDYLPEPGYFVAGAIAGGVSRTATAPLDRLKVYLLVNTKASTTVAISAATHGHPLAAAKTASKPITSAVASLYKSGGLRTFFAGNGLNVVKIMPETAIKFGTYEFAKRTLANLEGHNDPTKINPYSKFVAGGVAGMVAQFSVYPLDTLKFRLQCETVQGGLTGNALLAQTAKRMYATGGISAAYRGVTMGLVGMFPYSAIDMGTFEFLKTKLRKYKARAYGIHEDDTEAGYLAMGVIGATSGAIGATVVYPLNVLRTRLQTQGTEMHRPTYTGIWDVTTTTIKNEGVRGLYKGLTPNLLKVAPALSITWIVYESSKKFMGLQ